jgi:zinc protease
MPTHRTLVRATLAASATLVACAALVSVVHAQGAPPARPDQLTFPPLTYAPPKASEYRVKLSNGMVAYLVPDRTQPLVQIHVLLRVGPDLDPAGKEGLADLMMHQLTRGGTATRTPAQLEDRVAFLGATLESQMGGGGGGMFGIGGVPVTESESRVSVNLLSKDVDEGLGLLVECLKSPRFDGDRLALRKSQLLQSMKERNDDTAPIEARTWMTLMRGADHWTTRWTTQASIDGITADDLRAFHRRYVGPKNFLIAVSGDFDRAAMVKRLEKAFAGWPTPGERPGAPAAPAAAAAHGWYVVDKDVNQARVSLGLRALDRYDPDFAAARLMNDILGGGGFSSRLVNRIRSDEGLAYSVSSRFEGGTYYPDPLRIVFQTKVRSVAYAVSLALAEVNRMRDSLVTDDELATARNKMVESLPTSFETAGAIAGRLAAEEMTGRYSRDPAYFAEYATRLRAVTPQDIQRVARRLLDPSKMAFLVVGNTKEMMLGDGKHDVSVTALAGGEPTRLPLLDPLTMKPIANP